VAIEIYVKYPGGPTRITVTDMQWAFSKCPFGCNGYVTDERLRRVNWLRPWQVRKGKEGKEDDRWPSHAADGLALSTIFYQAVAVTVGQRQRLYS
jgi:hypothetical protein